MSKKKPSRPRQVEKLTQSLFGRSDEALSFSHRSISKTDTEMEKPKPDEKTVRTVSRISTPKKLSKVEERFELKGTGVSEKVRYQYENLPYPFRDPEEDKKRILITNMDDLVAINQYCYRARRDFDEEFRILIAGGGTGDATVFLAAQIARLPNAEIIYVDLSNESMNIARQRLRNQAQRLALPEMEKKVDFRLGSLLDVGEMGIGRFDYINCSGVLHHLDDPDAGLRALASVLKDDGVMTIMVYTQVGRTTVYHVQDMMRIVNRNEPEIEKKIRNTNLMLKNLPSTNLHKKNRRWISLENNPIELYDLFLHSQDRAYTFMQLSDWVSRVGLHLNYFVNHVKAHLTPQMLPLRLPRRILSRLVGMNPRETAAFSEYLLGTLNTYEFVLTWQTDTAAAWDDWDLIPSFSYAAKFSGLSSKLVSPLEENIQSIAFPVNSYPGNINMPIDISPLALASYPLIDDERTIRDIVLRLKSFNPIRTRESLRDELILCWKNLIEFDMIQFRHVSSNVKNLNRYNF